MGDSAAATTGAPQDSEASDLAGLERAMDRLSLEQALRDVEIANARVVDLTRRLVEANDQIWELTGRLEATSARAIAVSRPKEAIKRSPLGPMARKAAVVVRTRLR